MLLLDSTSDLVRVITDAASDIEVHVSYVDNNAGAITPASDDVPSITTATTTTIVGSPGASIQRSVRHINIRNNHASTACGVTVDHQDGTDTTVLYKATLAAGETITFGENGVWVYYDPNGKPYVGIGPFASQAEMEAGTSLTTIVAPGRQHFHPSAAKFWCKAGVTGAADASYNITSIGDTGTGIMTPTINVDFSSANWAGFIMIENLDASIDAIGDGQMAMIGLAGQAAGTLQCLCKNDDGTAAADPTKWHVVGFGDQ